MTTSTVQPATDPAAELAALAAVPQGIVKAWAAHDADAFAKVFVEDGTMTMPGVFCKGHEEIRAFMAAGFENAYKGTQVTGSPLDLVILDDQAAVLITEGGVMRPGETEVAADQAIRAYWVVVKRDGEWRLAAYQNTPRDEA
jgi:uncharacterized protein (TIGR02246 family)